MEQIQVNYQYEAYCAWLKHCATIVKPCAKSVDEVITYITNNYDTLPISQEELESLREFFAQHVEEHRYFNLIGNNTYQPAAVDRSSLMLKGFKIPKTEKNKYQICKYISFTHKTIDEMYEDDPCGYVVWDNALQLFYADGYGFLEIMDDLCIFQGVSQEDMDHLTYRFARYVQLFPHSGYALSCSEFINDINMCEKYEFYNNRRLFEKTLRNSGVQYEYLSKHKADQLKKAWYERFVPSSLHPYAEEHYYFDKDGYCGYLWHVFSYGDLDCQKEENAISAFDDQNKDECFVFFSNEEYAYKIKNACGFSAEVLNQFDDVFVMDDKLRWTYVHPHESACGPYFYQKCRT